MIKMTVFETGLNSKQLKDLFLDEDDHLFDEYIIAEDRYKLGFFVIFKSEAPGTVYSFGIKDNAIWVIDFAVRIEEMLENKPVKFTKKFRYFETTEDANEFFLQKYLL